MNVITIVNKAAILLFGVIFFFLSMYSLNPSLNPDYIPYSQMSMRQLSGNFYLLGALMSLFHKIGLGYEAFRVFLVFLHIHLTYLIVKNFSRSHSDIATVIFSLVVFTVLFEFFVIRLRAGLSIYCILIAAYLLHNYPRNFFHLGFVISLMLVVCGMVMHFYSGVFLLLFLLPYLYQSSKIDLFVKRNFLFVFFLYVSIWVTLISLFNEFYPSYRIDFFSDLNFYRLLLVAVLPIYIFTLLFLYKRKFYALIKYKNQFIWVVSSLLGLIIFYSLPIKIDSGEGLARILSLLSVAAIFILSVEVSVGAKIVYIFLAISAPIMILKDFL